MNFCEPYLSFLSVFTSNKTANADRLKWQIGKSLNCQIVTILLSGFFSGDSTTMTQAITMIQTRRSATGSGLLHPYHSVLKQIKSFSRDSQALEASTCRYTPFCSVLFCALNGGYAYTGNAALSTSCSV